MLDGYVKAVYIKKRHHATSVLPHIEFNVISDEAHFWVLDRVGLFFITLLLFPSTEKARNNVDDYLNYCKQQIKKFIQTHSYLLKFKFQQ